jgi:ABC-type multidrug transport system ATPase subunit
MKPLVVENISKAYGAKQKVQAVQQLSFEVERGELFGIIGPDGAGKTTLFRIIATLLLADAGKAALDGYDVVKDYKEIRRRIGYMPGRFSLYQDLSVEENIRFFATIFNTTIEENYDLVRDIYSQIEPFAKRKAGKLSGGMKQKLALSCALIHRPSVLLLDEPTTGVDAVSRKEFWEMLKSLRKQGITIIVSTPYMDEAGLCDRVALMQTGKIMTMDTPGGIVASFERPVMAARSHNMLELLDKAKSLPYVHDAYPFGEFHHVVLDREENKTALKADLSTFHADAQVMDTQPDIEDCFMALMKK